MASFAPVGYGVMFRLIPDAVKTRRGVQTGRGKSGRADCSSNGGGAADLVETGDDPLSPFGNYTSTAPAIRSAQKHAAARSRAVKEYFLYPDVRVRSRNPRTSAAAAV